MGCGRCVGGPSALRAVSRSPVSAVSADGGSSRLLPIASAAASWSRRGGVGCAATSCAGSMCGGIRCIGSRLVIAGGFVAAGRVGCAGDGSVACPFRRGVRISSEADGASSGRVCSGIASAGANQGEMIGCATGMPPRVRWASVVSKSIIALPVPDTTAAVSGSGPKYQPRASHKNGPAYAHHLADAWPAR